MNLSISIEFSLTYGPGRRCGQVPITVGVDRAFCIGRVAVRVCTGCPRTVIIGGSAVA